MQKTTSFFSERDCCISTSYITSNFFCPVLRPISSDEFNEIVIEDFGSIPQSSIKNNFNEKIEHPSTYTYSSDTENILIKTLKIFAYIIIFPYGLYKLFQFIAGLIVVPAWIFTKDELNEFKNNKIDKELQEGSDWKYQTITVKVDEYKIDATIVGKNSTLNNGKWILYSVGNASPYEFFFADIDSYDKEYKEILTELESNILFFNYPGVGLSSGFPNREAMAKAYKAMLSFLEDREKGIGANQIIGYGHSLGGAVQADALRTHELKEDIQYVFVKSRTFSDLSTTTSAKCFKPLDSLIKFLGWNMDSAKASKALNAPEIILQTADVKSYEILNDNSKIIGDGVINKEAALAEILLNSNEVISENKRFIGIPENHNQDLKDIPFLAKEINAFLYGIDQD
ncbi:MAG: CPn0927/CPn0928 family alpha/beta hydrolase fold protein [Simkaniaceae bacterium]